MSITVSSISPDTGPIEGGTTVTIIGTTFTSYYTRVYFNGTIATGLNVISPTELTCVTPAGLGSGVITVVVKNLGTAYSGQYRIAPTSIVSGDNWSPVSGTTIQCLTPRTQQYGSPSDNTYVVSSELNTTFTMRCAFVGACFYTSASASPITQAALPYRFQINTLGCQGGAGVAGDWSSHVYLQYDAGREGPADSLYPWPEPTLPALDDLVAGGIGMRIVATATSLRLLSNSWHGPLYLYGNWSLYEEQATIPFEYGSVELTVISVTPSESDIYGTVYGAGPGPRDVVVTGTNFKTGALVNFGNFAATNVVVIDSETITCTIPLGPSDLTTCTVTNIEIDPATNLYDFGTLDDAFDYLDLPPITVSVGGVSPDSGSVIGGGTVTITGTNFTAGATILFNGIPATNVTFVNSTTYTCTPPANPPGFATITLKFP